MPSTLDHDALTLLRLLLDLAGVDVHANLELLGRLRGCDRQRVSAWVQSLRRAGLVQADRLNLTLAGLAVAAATEPVELAPMSTEEQPVRLAAVA